MNECKPLGVGGSMHGGLGGGLEGSGHNGSLYSNMSGSLHGRGLHSFPSQLNLSSSVPRITDLAHECVLELLKLSSNVNGERV